MAGSSSRLRLLRFAPVTPLNGRGAQLVTAAPRVLPAIPAAYGIREFSPRELCLLTPSTLLVRFRITALRMERAATW